MVEVEFAAGNKRYPVEDLQRFDADSNPTPPETNTVPGEAPTVSVPGGPLPQKEASYEPGATPRRVAEAFVKKALYWGGLDRKYRPTRAEIATGQYHCPKCRARGIENVLKPAVYKRREGISEKLMSCPGCVFLIKELDIEIGGED
jgi:hypothetical protein